MQTKNTLGIKAKLIFAYERIGVRTIFHTITDIGFIITVKHTKTGRVTKTTRSIRNLQRCATQLNNGSISHTELVDCYREIGIFKHLLPFCQVIRIISSPVSNSKCLRPTISNGVIDIVLNAVHTLLALIPET